MAGPLLITVDVSVSPRIITLASNNDVITVQGLINVLREWEDDAINMSENKILDAAGKDNLGGGIAVRLTAILLNAQLAFEARAGPTYILCRVDGGNLVALDGARDPIDPIKTTAFTQVIRTSISSSVLT